MKITIGIASRGADIYYKLVDWLVYYNQCRPIEWDMEISIHMSPYSAESGQEKIFNAALLNNSDYLFIVDADVAPPRGCIEKMISHNKDIVIAPIWTFDGSSQDIHLGISTEPSLKKRIYKRAAGLQRIYGGCFGAMLVSKNVLNKFKDSTFFKWDNTLSDEYKELPSDNIFFLKCLKRNIEIYADWNIEPVSHFRHVNLCQETMNNFINRYYANK
jgi:hypothetical protein